MALILCRSRWLAHGGVYDRPEGGIRDALVAHLRERRLLVVLDNCEHLLEACRELVTSLVSDCAGLRVLCTSRQRLGVPGEATIVLRALELPAAGERLPVAGLAEVEALRLLMDRAVAVAPGFALTEENRGSSRAGCLVFGRVTSLLWQVSAAPVWTNQRAAIYAGVVSAADVTGWPGLAGGGGRS